MRQIPHLHTNVCLYGFQWIMTLTQPATLDWPVHHPPSLGSLQSLFPEWMTCPPLSLILLHPLSSRILPWAVCAVGRWVQLLIEPVILMRLIPWVLIELLAFFYFSLKRCAAGMISCCRPPLLLSLQISQSNNKKKRKTGDFCLCVHFQMRVRAWMYTWVWTKSEN